MDLKGIFRIIQSTPSKKAEPFKRWLAQVGAERIHQMQNPEFLGDSDILLRVGAMPFEPEIAYKLVKKQFIERMPGRGSDSRRNPSCVNHAKSVYWR